MKNPPKPPPPQLTNKTQPHRRTRRQHPQPNFFVNYQVAYTPLRRRRRPPPCPPPPPHWSINNWAENNPPSNPQTTKNYYLSRHRIACRPLFKLDDEQQSTAAATATAVAKSPNGAAANAVATTSATISSQLHTVAVKETASKFCRGRK